jgi:hypothetical protein
MQLDWFGQFFYASFASLTLCISRNPRNLFSVWRTYHTNTCKGYNFLFIPVAAVTLHVHVQVVWKYRPRPHMWRWFWIYMYICIGLGSIRIQSPPLPPSPINRVQIISIRLGGCLKRLFFVIGKSGGGGVVAVKTQQSSRATTAYLYRLNIGKKFFKYLKPVFIGSAWRR